MAIVDLYSKRQKRLNNPEPDVFTYEEIPEELRVQIVLIWREAIGESQYYGPQDATISLYIYLRDQLRKEFGKFSLAEVGNEVPERELRSFFMSCGDTDRVLSQVELTFRLIEGYVSKYEYQQSLREKTDSEDSICELNARFLEHGVGYQFESGQIIRIDSTLLHSEVMKPALHLLSQPEYEGANAEFLQAHKHYRHGIYKGTVSECLKAFESVLKIICHKQQWAYKQSDNAKRLIDICFENQLVPNYQQLQFSSLRSILETGVPTPRNKASAHGQGVASITVPSHLAQYVLHLTASTVLFLSEAEKQLS